MLSFLVTYYNQEKYVSRSLNSIFNQKMTSDFEVIIGDDGSSDKTVEIIKEYQTKYPNKIKLFIQNRDNTKKYFHIVRASLNRLNILSKATGDYVCFLDGDDEYCDLNFAQNAVDELANNSNIVGIAHKHVIINSNGEKKTYENLSNKELISLKDYIKGMYIHAGAIIFRRPKIEELDAVKKMQSFDDNDITYFFLNKGNLLYKNINVYNYYSNEDGFCASTNELEMKLLNAVDYEIIKNIISKNHFTLFLRYWNTIKYIYDSRNELNEEKYQKYRLICIKNGFSDRILSWGTLGTLNKCKVNLSIWFKQQLFKVARKMKM